ncbi:MAG: DegT/DnrJ/EryC1/StrS family aminotransferase, partial [Pseudomonadota bacterium]
ERIRMLRDHGMDKQRRYWHLEAGFNYRLTNLQSAIGLAQMERLDAFVEERKQTVALYHQGLRGLKAITRPMEEAWAISSYWLYTILIDENQSPLSRDQLAAALKQRGVDTRHVFPCLDRQPAFTSGHASGDLPVARRVERQGLSLPMYTGLSAADISQICDTIHGVMTAVSERSVSY